MKRELCRIFGFILNLSSLLAGASLDGNIVLPTQCSVCVSDMASFQWLASFLKLVIKIPDEFLVIGLAMRNVY